MMLTGGLGDPANDARMKQHLNDPRFKALVTAASSSVEEFFNLLQEETKKYADHAETLVRKARLVLAFRIDEEANEEHVIDLKTGPMPIMKTQTRATGNDELFDMIVSIDTRKRFVGLMTQEEDGISAYKTGAVRLVKGSMRALLKLRSLQELADRWKEDLELADSSTAGEASVLFGASGANPSGDEHVHQGYLEKQSEWLKNWNSRYVMLKWNERSRPQLRFFSSQSAARSAPARHFAELHSGIDCVPLQGEQLAFSLVDRRRGGRVLFVLRATSERSMREWKQAFEDAITSRARALDIAKKRLRGESLSGSTGDLSNGGTRGPTGGLLDLLLATQRVCTSHSEQLRQAEEERRMSKENIARLENRAQEADDFLIYSTIESDFTTIRKHLGWTFVPLSAFALLIAKKVGDRMIRFVQSSSSWLGSFFHSQHQEKLGYLVFTSILSALVKYVTESKAFELNRRHWRVNGLAINTIWRLKLSSMKQLSLPPIHSQAMWNVEFRTNAEKLYLLALELRGLWVKTAQFLGARPDVVPEQALQVLKRLHDAVPATPFAEVKVLVEKELNGPLTKYFSSFDEDVLASASIGQVHVAHLLDGTKCVVKAQHPNVEQKILQDLKNMETIMGWIEVIEPDFEGRPLVQEWSREVSKELEFDKEAENMLDVGRNLASDPTVYAALPMPIQGLYTKRCLVMKFVPGAKVNDLDNLRRVSGVDTEDQRSNLAMDICNAFARQLFVDGIFQADAHPGNILVAQRSALDPSAVQFLPPAPENDPNRAIPILLDFGLTKRLPYQKRLAFSRLICAMQNLDIGQLLLSFDEMGLRLKREDPFEDLSELRFAFRETESANESRATTMAHIQKAREKYEALPRDQRNPVEAFPSELMLFFRTVFLLRGLCTSLNVRVKYLKTMSSWAKRALREHSASESSTATASPMRLPATAPQSSLESRLLAKCAENGVIGCQVNLLKFSSSSCYHLADIAFGRLHDVDHRPVTKDTMFPALSLAQGVAQVVVRTLFEGKMDWPVKAIWKQFPNEALTIKELLSGDLSKLPFSATSLPSKFSIASMHRWQEHIDFVQNLQASNDSQAEESPSSVVLPWELSTLAFTYGWMITGLIQAAFTKQDPADGCAYERFVRETIAPKLAQNGGLHSFQVRAPDAELPLPPPKKGISVQEEEEVNLKRDSHRIAVNARYASLSVDLERISGGAVDLDKMWDLQSATEMPSTASANPGGFDFGAILRSLGPSFSGKEYLIDPRVMNTVFARGSASPNCNLLTSASSLTALMAACGNDGIHDGSQILPKSVSDFLTEEFIAESPSPALEPLGERLGMKVFEFKTLSDGTIIRGFGQVAFGGSMTLCIPACGLAMTVLTNDLTLERDLTRSLLEEVCKDFGLHLASEV